MAFIFATTVAALSSMESWVNTREDFGVRGIVSTFKVGGGTKKESEKRRWTSFGVSIKG